MPLNCMPNSLAKFSRSPLYRDALLLGVMALGAGCGIIYEYLIAHYAGRILGSVDTAVYAVIGLMIVAMGIGAFYARSIKCPYSGFAWLEAFIAIIGGTAVLAMAAIFALTYVLPLQLQQAFGLHDTVELSGGPIFALQKTAEAFPYVVGLFLGILIGMEIPFIARIREDIYKDKLQHNAGTVYGADYIGGGLGAAVWIWVMLSQPIIVSAAITAIINLALGLVFLFHFHARIRGVKYLLALNVVSAALLILVLINGTQWMNAMNNMLYSDGVVYSNNTKYQNIVITERANPSGQASILNLYINGQLQFSSADEVIYHSLLVTPVMMASESQDRILIIGGGDGLAAREVLNWSPSSITVVELDPTMVAIFRGQQSDVPQWLNRRILGLNQNAFNHPSLEFIIGDAFNVVEQLADGQQYFDAIIVDLPDPNHPDLNKLYSAFFYAKLASLLQGDGALVVQSTSPYHSKKAFISIGNTLEAAGLYIDPYHANVPSFGQWGWTLATRYGASGKQRIDRWQSLTHDYLTLQQVQAAFAFSKNFFAEKNTIKVNHLSAPTLYNYHSEGWRKQSGIFQVPRQPE